MQVERERGPASFDGGQQGAESGEDPAETVRRATGSRLRDEVPTTAPGVIFSAAETRWLTALSAWHTDAGEVDAVDRAAVEAALWAEERAASTAFIRAPAPILADLPRKLWLLEREASEIAYRDACGRALVGWLSDFRADLMRLLRDG